MTAIDPRVVQETRTTPDPSALTTAQSLERAAAERDYTDGKIEVLGVVGAREHQVTGDHDVAVEEPRQAVRVVT